MNNFLIEHLPTIIQIMVVVAGMAFLFVAWILCSMENWVAGVVTGLLGLLLIAVPVDAHFSERHRLRTEESQLRQLTTACTQAPTTVEDRGVHLYAGTVVDPPSLLGVTGGLRPAAAPAVFVRVDGPTTNLTLQNSELVVQGRDTSLQPGDRLAFCGHESEPVHWWPQIGYQDGEGVGAVYGEPSGPYPAVRWVIDTNN